MTKGEAMEVLADLLQAKDARIQQLQSEVLRITREREWAREKLREAEMRNHRLNWLLTQKEEARING